MIPATVSALRPDASHGQLDAARVALAQAGAALLAAARSGAFTQAAAHELRAEADRAALAALLAGERARGTAVTAPKASAR